MRGEAERELNRMSEAVDATGDLWAGPRALGLTRVQVWTLLGDVDNALRALEAAQIEGQSPTIPFGKLSTDPMFDRVRSHPRLPALLRVTRDLTG